MNFGFTEEQELLRAEVRKFLDATAPIEEVRRLSESPDGFSRELWKQIAELGWVGLLAPEAHGGAGLGWVDLVGVLEETGRSLFPSPLLSHCLAVDAIVQHGSEAQQKAWLPRLADGSAIGSVALAEADDLPGPEGVHLAGEPVQGGFVLRGEKLFVTDVGAADVFVVALRAEGALRLALVERSAEGVVAEDWPGIDLTRRLGRLRLDGVQVPAEALLAGGEEALGRILDAGATALALEAAGAADAALRLTCDYARQRVQFGRAIAQFQGVKHPLAEIHVDVESWRSLAYYAAWCLDERHPDTSLAASRAKAYASEAFPRIGIDVVGLHGGIGYTWEYPAQLYLKRAKAMRPLFGDADWHHERVARLGGLGGS